MDPCTRAPARWRRRGPGGIRAVGFFVLGCAAAWGCAEGVVSQGSGTGGGTASTGTGVGPTGSGVGSSGGGATVGSSGGGATVGSTGNGATVGSTGNGTTVGSTGPSGSTGASTSTGTSGAGGSVGAGGGPYDTPVMCSSNTSWTSGTDESMRPGEACVTCHVLFGQATGHTFDIAGTVYPTAHEPNDCDGANVSGAQVVITDSSGAQTTLPVNSVGNFYHATLIGLGALPTPYYAKVTYNGQVLKMVTAQTSGDCNSCHTETGTNSAPGRIILPP